MTTFYTRPGDYAGQARRAAINQASTRVVVDERLDHQLLRAVAQGGQRQRFVIDMIRQGYAENADRAREHQTRRRLLARQAFQQVVAGLEIGLPATFVVARRRATGHRCEMKHGIERLLEQGGEQRRVGQSAAHRPHARVFKAGQREVDRDQFRDVGIGRERLDQRGTDKTPGAGDCDTQTPLPAVFGCPNP